MSGVKMEDSKAADFFFSIIPNLESISQLWFDLRRGSYTLSLKTNGYGLNIKMVEFALKLLMFYSGLMVSVDYALKCDDGLMEYCLKVEL